MKQSEVKELVVAEIANYKQINDAGIVELILGFVDMRSKIKKPMTELAVKLFVKRLNKLSDSRREAEAMLEIAIINNWLSVYSPKDDNSTNGSISGI